MNTNTTTRGVPAFLTGDNQNHSVTAACPGKGRRHGTVKVFAGKRLLTTVRLAAPRADSRTVVPVATSATPYTWPLHVVVTTNGRQVRIEGLGVAAG